MASNSQPSFSMRAVIFGIKKTFPRVSGIENSELIGNDKERILYLDSRPVEEYSVSHIPGSKQVDHEAEEPWKDIDFKNTDKVVCYCSVGYRSSVLANKLTSHFRREGLNIPVFNLEGGVFQWAMDGGPLEGENPHKVHQYSSVWGRLLPENMRYTDAKL